MRIRRSTTELYPLSGAWGRGKVCNSPPSYRLRLVQKIFVTGEWAVLTKASIAQWQSTGLVNQGSRVQSSLEAVRLSSFFLTPAPRGFDVFSWSSTTSNDIWHLSVQRAWICWSLCSHGASLAQWQSTGLVNQGSWVQISQEATLLRFLTFIQACRSYLISRKLKVQLYMLLGLLFIWLIPRFPNRMDTRDGRHGLKKATYMLLAPATLSVTAPRWHLHWRVPVRIRLDRELIREEHFLKIECTGSLAEWSKALVLGTSPKGRGFESHSCQETFWGYLTLNFGSKRFCSRWGSNSQPRHISCTSDCHISTVR